MTEKLRDFEQADMPEKPAGFWKLAGPGAILVGLSIGAGEIIIWPRIAAEYGATMVWAAILGVFLQMWVNFEVGRWTIATGESVYTGFARVWGGFGLVFIGANVLGWLAPGWGRTSGLALKALLVGPEGFGSDPFWTVVTFAAVAALLFGPKIAYKSVERTIELLVIMNLRFLPRSARPGPVHTFMMIVCCCVYGGFAIACTLWELGILKEG